MKKTKINSIIIFLAVLIGYYLANKLFNFTIFCPIKKLTNFYCPGCGITRMIWSIFQLDFYQAFRFNPLVFILLTCFLIIKLYEFIFHKTVILNSKITYTLLIIVILFGIIRNIPGWEFLQPTYI